MFKMINTIQPYAWGSHSFIQNIVGDAQAFGTPMAELWMGAHPKAPSKLIMRNRTRDLNKVLEYPGRRYLGIKTARLKRTLPFLLKVLAAEKALSIQAHPTKARAEKGFKEENKAKVSLKSDSRNYKDPNHKPELICALTEFYAMCGFRTYDKIIQNFVRFDLGPFFSSFAEFCKQPDERSLRSLFGEILRSDEEKCQRIINHIRFELDQIDIFFAPDGEEEKLIRTWIWLLLEQYPNDIGILSPLFLNLFMLSPTEAIFLPAGILHAYLKGAGIEIMASSDNVLRGGLTPKYIDVPELISTLSFEPFMPQIICPMPNSDGLRIYDAPVEDFSLAALTLHDNSCDFETMTAQIVFCLEGRACICNDKETHEIQAGESYFVPVCDNRYSISGKGTFFIATYKL